MELTSCPAPAELEELADDLLQPARREALEMHVENCQRCRCLLQQMAELQSAELATQTGSLQQHPAAPREIAGCRLMRMLGRGSRSEVWLAEEQQMQRAVAVKLIPAARADRDTLRQHWLAEVRLAAALNHPGLVRLYRAEETAAWFVLIFEYVSGGTLKERGPCQNSEQAVRLTRALSAALQHMHQQEILHLDLKPANVLLEWNDQSGWEDCVPRISDFGISLRQSADDPLAAVRVSGLGTPPWMAPEQLTSPISRLTAQADVCGLGGILYFLLTGKPPYSGTTVESLLEQMLTQEPAELPREICPDLRLICHRCLMRQPEYRWTSVSEVQLALDDWLERQQRRQKNAYSMQRRRLLAITALAAAVMLPMIITVLPHSGSAAAEIQSEADFQRWLAKPAEALDAAAASRLVQAAEVRVQRLLASGKAVQAAELGVLLGRAGARLDASLVTENYPLAQQLLLQAERLLAAATQTPPPDDRWHEELAATRVALAGSKAPPSGVSQPNGTAHAGWRYQQLERALAPVSRLTELRQQVFWTAAILDQMTERRLLQNPAAAHQFQSRIMALLPSLLQIPDIKTRLLLQSGTAAFSDEITASLTAPDWLLPADRTAVVKSIVNELLLGKILAATTQQPSAAQVSAKSIAAVLQECSQWLQKLQQPPELLPLILHEELIRVVAERATDHRGRGELAQAEQLQRGYEEICVAGVRQFPGNADVLLALSEAHLQAWKNHLRRDRPDAAVQSLQESLHAAEEALRCNPGSQRARFQVANRLSRLAAFLAEP